MNNSTENGPNQARYAEKRREYSRKYREENLEWVRAKQRIAYKRLHPGKSKYRDLKYPKVKLHCCQCGKELENTVYRRRRAAEGAKKFVCKSGTSECWSNELYARNPESRRNEQKEKRKKYLAAKGRERRGREKSA